MLCIIIYICTSHVFIIWSPCYDDTWIIYLTRHPWLMHLHLCFHSWPLQTWAGTLTVWTGCRPRSVNSLNQCHINEGWTRCCPHSKWWFMSIWSHVQVMDCDVSDCTHVLLRLVLHTCPYICFSFLQCHYFSHVGPIMQYLKVTSFFLNHHNHYVHVHPMSNF